MPDPVILVGFVLGAILGVALRHWGRTYDEERFQNVTRNALREMRENNAIRHTVLEFVKLARHRANDLTDVDWHRLVDAVIHDSTPESIRELYHRQCGTQLEDRSETKVKP